jgi:hypothetical protein
MVDKQLKDDLKLFKRVLHVTSPKLNRFNDYWPGNSKDKVMKNIENGMKRLANFIEQRGIDELC